VRDPIGTPTPHEQQGEAREVPISTMANDVCKRAKRDKQGEKAAWFPRPLE